MAKNHYINNKDFLTEMIKYRQSIAKAKKAGEKKPQIPRYVAECFMKIAENLSHKPNFLSYTFRDEMVADAIENCVMYVDNFDPSKSGNPFAYFTQITYFAFLRRIQKERSSYMSSTRQLNQLVYWMNLNLMKMMMEHSVSSNSMKTSLSLSRTMKLQKQQKITKRSRWKNSWKKINENCYSWRYSFRS